MMRNLFIFLAIFVTACAPAEEKPAELLRPEAPMVWPAPPETPRIQLVYAFREPKDLGFATPFFDRVWAFVAGAEYRGMTRPYAIAVNGQRLAIADPGAKVVHLYDMVDEAYHRLDKAGDVSLRSPVGVVYIGGNLFVADSALNKVFAYDAEGDLVLTIDDLKRPTGLAFDQGTGRLYIADTLNHQIAVYDKSGQRLFNFGSRGIGPGQFNFPTHLSLSGGKLFVNDTMNFRLETFDLDGNHKSSFGKHGDGSGNFAQPKGVGIDSEGHIYVADAIFNRVQIFDAEGNFLLAFGEHGGNLGAFWLPSGLLIDQDRIYVADSYNRRIQVFEFLGGDT